MGSNQGETILASIPYLASLNAERGFLLNVEEITPVSYNVSCALLCLNLLVLWNRSFSYSHQWWLSLSKRQQKVNHLSLSPTVASAQSPLQAYIAPLITINTHN